jgi:DMSO/TMAO reductase YedYZ molybdopterin-dependent catalytic subunit/cytochrome c553
MSQDRRHFLRHALIGGAGLVAACTTRSEPRGPAPKAPKTSTPEPKATSPEPAADALPDGLDADLFEMYTRRPLTLETKRSSFGYGVLTPMSRFFVRNNLPMPDASILDDPLRWELAVEGVAKPRAVTLAELMGLGVETITTVIQCSGNGRRFFEHGPSGSQWGTGAAGCAMWTGVPVRRLVEALGGPAAGAAFMTSTGGDPLPDGVDPLDVVVERSIPLEKALSDCLLAWEMNGQPIPLTHGGPLRLIVPGYYGCNQIKYIRKLALTAQETQAKIQRSGYRFRPIGEKGSPEHPSLWAMNVKSWVQGPGADGEPVLAGKVSFHGVAFAGEEDVAQVEVSMDGGETWTKARWIGPDMGPHAWRTFVHDAELAPGAHTIHSRATSASGAVQPELRVENERGYRHNAWRDHGLTVEVVAELPKKAPRKEKEGAGSPASSSTGVAPGSAELSAQGERGRAAFVTDAQPNCGTCHTLGDAGTEGVVGPNLDEMAPDAARVEAAVTNGVGSMPPYKGRLKPGQIKDIARYVAEATRKK